MRLELRISFGASASVFWSSMPVKTQKGRQTLCEHQRRGKGVYLHQLVLMSTPKVSQCRIGCHQVHGHPMPPTFYFLRISIENLGGQKKTRDTVQTSICVSRHLESLKFCSTSVGTALRFRPLSKGSMGKLFGGSLS